MNFYVNFFSRCNSDRTITPVYAKRACLDSFIAHPEHRHMCVGEEHDDWADPMGNVLVTSKKTRITYWNRDCGMCNEEAPDDLIRWTIQVRRLAFVLLMTFKKL